MEQVSTNTVPHDKASQRQSLWQNMQAKKPQHTCIKAWLLTMYIQGVVVAACWECAHMEG